MPKQKILIILDRLLILRVQGMKRLTLDLSYFPDEEILLDVCGDAGAGRLYVEDDIKDWYVSSSCRLSDCTNCRSPLGYTSS